MLTVEARGEVTDVVMGTIFPTAQLRDQAVKEYHAIEGGEQTRGRLADYVTAQKGI